MSRTKRGTVAVKTWGEIIEENRARLQFFQEHLQTSADEGQAVQYLRERHSALLEGVFDEPDAAASGGNTDPSPDRPA